MTDRNNAEKEDFLQKLGNCTKVIEMASTPARLYILIAHVQLALRHPNNTGASAEIAREIAMNMTEAVCHLVPEVREVIEMGWNPAYDVTNNYFEEEFTIHEPRYNNGVPIYWMYLNWPHLEEAIKAYFEPYASEPSATPVPEMLEEHISTLKRYLAHYIEAPQWRDNPSATQENIDFLDSLSKSVASLSSRSEISVFLAQCLQIGLDPI